MSPRTCGFAMFQFKKFACPPFLKVMLKQNLCGFYTNNLNEKEMFNYLENSLFILEIT
jgi:hypothetical protein